MSAGEHTAAEPKQRTRPIRVLVAKPGLDGHDRGAKVMARAFRDAGFEVIYTGLFQTPEMIANAALQEDVDVVGLSILSGAHMALFPAIMEALRAVGRDDALGIARVFGPGTPLQEAVAYIREHAPIREDVP